MEKYGLIGMLLVFLLTGCSVSIDNASSKSEEFASTAEELSSTLNDVRDEMESLKDKTNLSSKDQALIVEQTDAAIRVIDKFKEEEAPFIANIAKKVVIKELNKKTTLLESIKEKAEKGTANEEDVNKIIETLSDDFEINLFEK
ncbi:hypothetical protein [Bacillus sp. OK048]|uniref:hypothetical protein n=1 Tax=Bacillus sp. OK048 TaxID=1882761 RepID=UPI000890D11F|nr:hypothetical protein [Bacillus sp. OK048]SDM85904.1 hypothetical protein SAMN05443253_10675 [Bacillus sp. OK048]